MDRANLRTQVIPGHAKHHILHIEDDPEVAESISALLESNGYEAAHAADGLSGLIAFNQNPEQWAMVLVDLTLPHVSGNALFKEMHRIRPSLPLIVLTGANPAPIWKSTNRARLFSGTSRSPPRRFSRTSRR